MQQSGRSPTYLLVLVLLLHFVLCAAYSLVVPLAEAPDELSHFDFARFVAQRRALPTWHDVGESIQPPLYYLLGAPLIAHLPADLSFAKSNPDFRLGDAQGPQNLFIHTAAEAPPFGGGPLAMHILRLLSATLSTLAVWAVYQTLRLLFEG
ncbi:MAG: hypothetical protein GX605_03185, partial [Chloroflexi bacterium]|nr:hypothetical protein [Chloroflexota bacterium]